MPEAQTAPPPVAVQAPKPKLHFGRLKLVEHAHNTHFADIPHDIIPEVVAQPSYWAHYTQVVRPMDLIVCFWEDGTREVWYRVMFVSPVGLKLSKLFPDIEHESVGEEEAADYKVVWKGTGAKWCVVRADNGNVLKDKLPSKGEAMAFLGTYLKETRQ